MSSNRLRLRRASLSLNLAKHDIYKSRSESRTETVGLIDPSTVASILTPDLLQTTPNFGTASDGVTITISRVGNYLLQADESNTPGKSYSAIHSETQQEFTCKVLPLNGYRDLLAVYFRVGCHPHIVTLQEVIVGASCVYAFFPRHYGDLHSYVRSVRRLKEPEAAKYFGQIVSVVAHCHEEGVVLRDLKLRKFVFKDSDRTELMLESLDDACLLDPESNDDLLCDRHGCPAYVSPEILSAADSKYSGRAADVWCLGVILFTMLVGRYPFHDPDPVTLFRSIRHVRYMLPRGTISDSATSLVRWILRCDPVERPAACEINKHPWFEMSRRAAHWRGELYTGSTVVVINIDQQLYNNNSSSNAVVVASKDMNCERCCSHESVTDQLVPQQQQQQQQQQRHGNISIANFVF